jgi:hypothetical protein
MGSYTYIGGNPAEVTRVIMAQRSSESQEPLRIVGQAPVGLLINAQEAMPEQARREFLRCLS